MKEIFIRYETDGAGRELKFPYKFMFPLQEAMFDLLAPKCIAIEYPNLLFLRCDNASLVHVFPSEVLVTLSNSFHPPLIHVTDFYPELCKIPQPINFQ